MTVTISTLYFYLITIITKVYKMISATAYYKLDFTCLDIYWFTQQEV